MRRPALGGPHAVTVVSVAANLGGLALFAIPGFGVTACCRELGRLPFGRRLGYAYLFGVLTVGGGLFAAGYLFGIPLHRPEIALAAALPAGIGLVVWRSRRGESRDRWRRKRAAAGWRLWAGLAVAAVLLGPLASALTAPLADWDGRMTWTPLAAAMRHEGTVEASVMRDSHWFVVNSNYPPLIPLAQVAVQEMFGAGEDEQFFRVLYVGFLVALFLVLYDGARRTSDPAAASLTILSAALPPFVSYGAGGATSAYSDLALAGFYGAALVLLLLAPAGPGASSAGGLLLAGAVWTKNEGVLLAVAALFFAAFRRTRRRRSPPSAAVVRLVATAAPGCAAAALLAAWRAGIPHRIDVDFFTGLGVSDVIRGVFFRLPVILPEVARWTFRWAGWCGFWWIFLAVVAVGYSAFRRLRPRLMILAGLVPLAVGWGAYTVSPSVGELVGETWDRFLLQGLIPLGVSFACALGELRRELARGSREGDSPRAPASQGTS